MDPDLGDESDSSRSTSPPPKKMNLDKGSPSINHSPQCSRSNHQNGVKESPTSSSSGVAKCKHHAKPEKFVPREDLVVQITDMGICRNGAIKALYWTGNKSVQAASNWIFDQPERDLNTPLEDELEMIRAQQAEREREEREKEELIRMCRKVNHSHMHHHHHHVHHHDESLDEDELEDLHSEDEIEDEDEEDEEEEDEDEEEDMDMEFKMVFVINRALDLTPGQMTLYVSKATAGLFRKINSQAQSVTVGPDELAMWGEFGERTMILWADSEQHIKDLELMGRNLQLPCYMMECRESWLKGMDGGSDNRTITKTVLGIFGEEREVNKVTGRLKVVT